MLSAITIVLIILSMIAVIFSGAILVSGYAISTPVPRVIGNVPKDIKAEKIEFPSKSGSVLHGWLAQGASGNGVIVLLHGVHADRRSQLNRMRLLHNAGYTVLAFDFQAHGESTGKHITFGYLEGLDVLAAVNYSKQRFPNEHIGLIGESMGGAAAILAPQPLSVDAVVIESVYPDINHAICNRLKIHLGPEGCLLTPFYLALMPLVIGINESNLRPIEHINSLKAPIMVLNGALDKRTPLNEAKALFKHASNPKFFWAVKGAGHVDLLNAAPDEWKAHVLPFLAKYLNVRN